MPSGPLAGSSSKTRSATEAPWFTLKLTILFSQLVDYRIEFSKWWTTEFKHIKFPSHGTVFDYFLDPNTHKWLPWSEKVPKFDLDPDAPLQVQYPMSMSLYSEDDIEPTL